MKDIYHYFYQFKESFLTENPTGGLIRMTKCVIFRICEKDNKTDEHNISLFLCLHFKNILI